VSRRPTYIIAEAGVNHDGDVGDALRLVDAAADCGADCVKFQIFSAGAISSAAAPKAQYQLSTTDSAETAHDMLAALELPLDGFFKLKERATARKIDFLCTPFDHASLRFLVDELRLKTIKIGSGDLTNAPLLLDAARAGTDVILSTGMSRLDEIEHALGVLAFGNAEAGTAPGALAFKAAWANPLRRATLRDRVVLLHCTTEYPAPPESINLLAIDTLREAFGLAVGYSDHSEGTEVAIAAVARGASMLEKHLTLDRSRPGPDHAASLEPAAFAAMVAAVRTIDLALGDGAKVVQAAERGNVAVVRKSLVARVAIRAGELYSEQNLTCKRPGHGMSPYRLWDLYGKPAPRDFEPDDLIEE